jgi:23S rRNA (cytosine1962-C5)-methyltransferase
MTYLNSERPTQVQLARNLVRQIKRGHAWVYADALRGVPSVEPGSPARLLDNRGGKEIARGYLDPDSPLVLRLCTVQPGEALDDRWLLRRLASAIDLRRTLFPDPDQTNAYRLINGEGDGLPGLVCDLYARAAVLVTDGAGPAGFYHIPQIAAWLAGQFDLETVIHRFRLPDRSGAEVIIGEPAVEPISFRENGLNFTADLIAGQKTGFFLDQRDNRHFLQPFSAGAQVLNAFGYTGAFSVYAGQAGAGHVITLDSAAPALGLADRHWAINDLDPGKHETVNADAFDYLEQASRQKDTWDLVILDPPSFASSEANVPAAVNAYTKLVRLGTAVTSPGGLLAAASCSSHITRQMFLEVIEQAISDARRQATVLTVRGQPPDHPAPLVMPELQYLKFVLIKLD